MGKTMLPLIGVLAAVTIAVVAFAAVAAQVPPTGPGQPTDLDPMLPGLEGIPPEQMFSHFIGAQVNLTDKNGGPMVVKVTPGTVSSISDNSITITPNGQTVTQTFRITPNTVVHAMPGRGSLQALATGNHIIVVTQGDSLDAVVIAKPEMAERMGFRHPMFR